MQILINIYKQDYEDIKTYGVIHDEFRDDIAEAIKNGKVLTTHGRLVDADDVSNINIWATESGQFRLSAPVIVDPYEREVTHE